MAHPTLYGIVPPIITPMNADESVNIPELRRQIERQIAGGVHGIFCFGTNGEGYILSMKGFSKRRSTRSPGVFRCTPVRAASPRRIRCI